CLSPFPCHRPLCPAELGRSHRAGAVLSLGNPPPVERRSADGQGVLGRRDLDDGAIPRFAGPLWCRRRRTISHPGSASGSETQETQRREKADIGRRVECLPESPEFFVSPFFFSVPSVSEGNGRASVVRARVSPRRKPGSILQRPCLWTPTFVGVTRRS